LIYNFVKDYEEKRIEFIKSKELEIIEEETRNLEFFDKKKYPIVNEYILPAKKAGGRFAMFPFKYMKVGESFYVPLIDFKSCKNKKRPLTCLMQRIYRMLQYQQEKNYVKKTKRFTTREVAEKGVRVWRIK
ncbi:MAG: hypothetical protein KAQ85_08490, partial [Thermodesulfovibrionia bacterium]|nr:hypothetical protein [Thermodesulfovibrionia bacterium]